MNDILKKYITDLEEKARKNRKEQLMDMGLVCKQYINPSDISKYTDVQYEWNFQNQIQLYYIWVPIEITDEEFQYVMYLQDKARYKRVHNINVNYKGIKVFAWIIALLSLIVFPVLSNGGETLLALFLFLVALSCGVTLYIFAEIVRTLQNINTRI